MGVDGEKKEIVKTIVMLADNLGMDVTAEGIETRAQMTQLKALGCQRGQGYYFSRPVDAETAMLLIAADLRQEEKMQG